MWNFVGYVHFHDHAHKIHFISFMVSIRLRARDGATAYFYIESVAFKAEGCTALLVLSMYLPLLLCMIDKIWPSAFSIWLSIAATMSYFLYKSSSFYMAHCSFPIIAVYFRARLFAVCHFVHYCACTLILFNAQQLSQPSDCNQYPSVITPWLWFDFPWIRNDLNGNKGVLNKTTV